MSYSENTNKEHLKGVYGKRKIRSAEILRHEVKFLCLILTSC